jgi:hypothetical protein
MRIRIRDTESFRPWIGDPGWKKFGSGIQDKHHGSATMISGQACMTLKTLLSTSATKFFSCKLNKNIPKYTHSQVTSTM